MLPLNAPLHWRSNKIIEDERAIHQQRETEDLQPLERLPSESQGDNPDE